MIPYSPNSTYSLFGITFYTETTFLMLALVVFFFMIRDKFKKGELFPLTVTTALSAIIGGRLWYYVFDGRGLDSLIDILDPAKGGLMSLGVMIFGGLALFVFSITKKTEEDWQIRLGRYADTMILPFTLSLAVFRIGCFIDGHKLGFPASMPWSIFIENVARHPVALYLSLNAFIIFFILKLISKKTRSEGYLAAIFLIIYPVTRFFIEFTTMNEIRYHSLTLIQYMLLSFILIGTLILAHIRKYDNKNKK